MFRSLLGRGRGVAPPGPASPPRAGKPAPQDELALILDRFCLAHQGSFCSVCSERCPEPGAIVVEMGKPRVDPDKCTGCRICHDVCPAPRNAVFLVARKARSGMIGKTVDETRPDDADHE
jgi:MinD superfamily P-loop ATPase